MRTQIFSILLVLILANSCTFAHNSLYYLKGGPQVISHNFANFEALPGIGLGARFQKERHGCDLSLNLSTIIVGGDLTLKGLYLRYSNPEKENQLYYGLGAGLGGSCFIIGGPRGYLNAEGVVGYEFRHRKHFKTFVQLELSNELLGTGGFRLASQSATLSLGAGF